MAEDFRAKAIDAGERMAALIANYDSLGVALSLDHFEHGMQAAFEDFDAPDPDELTDLALATARAALKRRKQH